MVFYENMAASHFKKIIRTHYKKEGRHALPWRHTRDPYAILVSEIMLQQTQVARVEGYYEKFLKRFPDFAALARAKTGAVLKEWQGLGYNRRALALQKIARIVLKEFNGRLPRERVALEALPGIGKGTSGSLRAFAFNEPEIFIETNIRRVFLHFFFPKKKVVTDEELTRYMERTLDRKHPREWYWALMDYGAMLGNGRMTTPNPNRRSAHYRRQSTFSGSDRELRGKILRLVLAKKKFLVGNLKEIFGADAPRAGKLAEKLVAEGFLGRKGEYLCIK